MGDHLMDSRISGVGIQELITKDGKTLDGELNHRKFRTNEGM